MVRASASSTSPESRTSVTRPSPPISFAADTAESPSRSQIATEAPKAVRARAIPLPIPAPPPVTTATLSVSSTDEGTMDTTSPAL